MSLILQDSSLALWLVTVDDNGVLATQSVGSGTPSIPILNDISESTSWIIGVTIFGQLSPIPTTLNPANPTFMKMVSVSEETTWTVGVTLYGQLTTALFALPLTVRGAGKITLVIGVGVIS